MLLNAEPSQAQDPALARCLGWSLQDGDHRNHLSSQGTRSFPFSHKPMKPHVKEHVCVLKCYKGLIGYTNIKTSLDKIFRTCFPKHGPTASAGPNVLGSGLCRRDHQCLELCRTGGWYSQQARRKKKRTNGTNWLWVNGIAGT